MRYGILILAILTVFAGEVCGHAITALSVVADFKADGTFGLELGVDVKLVRDDEDPSGVTVADPNAPLSEEEIEAVRAQVVEYIETSLRFYFGKESFAPEFAIEEVPAAATEGANSGAMGSEDAPVKHYAARGSGEIPGSAKEFLLEASPDAVAPVIFIIFQDGKPTRHSQVLYSGEFSRPVDLESIRSGEALPGRKPQVDVSKSQKAAEVEESSRPKVEKVEGVYGIDRIERGEDSDRGWGRDFQTGLAEGARQFAPMGLASTLFVVGFLLLSWRIEMVFLQVVAFTVAHSLALVLGALELAKVSPEIVAVAPALSVVIIAVDNLSWKEPGGWRVVLVAVLGLAHGLGFAQAIVWERWVAPSLVPGLVGFNLGIEVGQLTVILVAMVALAWMRGWAHYRSCVVIPGSISLGGAGIYLAVVALKANGSL